MSEQREAFDVIGWNKTIRDSVDALLAEAGYSEDSSARIQLSCMNFSPASAPSAEPVNFDASDTNFSGVLVPLYEASILSAAVAAAREQDARVCEKVAFKRADGSTPPTMIEHNKAVAKCSKAIRALQSPDGLEALRGMLHSAISSALGDAGAFYTDRDVTERIDRVLKGD